MKVTIQPVVDPFPQPPFSDLHRIVFSRIREESAPLGDVASFERATPAAGSEVAGALH